MVLFSFLEDKERRIKRAIPYPGFHDFVETVSGSAKSTFQLDVDIDTEHQIDVEVDGRGQLETTHWTRDIANNRITTGSAVNVGSWFRARIYLK